MAAGEKKDFVGKDRTKCDRPDELFEDQNPIQFCLSLIYLISGLLLVHDGLYVTV